MQQLLRLPRQHGRVVTAAIILAIAAVVATYVVVDDPVADFFTPHLAYAFRWINVTTGTVAFLGLLAVTTPRWSTYAPPFRDAVGCLLALLFVTATGAGYALSVTLPPNELAVAVTFAHLGALRILVRALSGQYAAYRAPTGPAA